MARSLAREGLRPNEISRRTGIPSSTVRYWLNDGYGRPPRRRTLDLDSLSLSAYAHLLGVYLGDGHIARLPRTYRLDITLDSRYPEIIEEVRRSVADVLSPNIASVRRVRDQNAVRVQGHSNLLPSLFPQHGPGRKHERPIYLADWQAEIVAERPEYFVRGLIQSDGCRLSNKVWGGKYAYPRSFFSQVSTDIMGLFCAACDQLGVEYRLNNPRSASIAKATSVAILDEFVGPKR